MVAGELEGGLQPRNIRSCRWSVQLVQKPQGQADGSQGRIPEVQVEERFETVILVHDRIVRNHRRRSPSRQDAANRRCPLLRERAISCRRREGQEDDGFAQRWPLVRLSSRRTSGCPAQSKRRTVGRNRPRSQDPRHAFRWDDVCQSANRQKMRTQTQEDTAAARQKDQWIKEAR